MRSIPLRTTIIWLFVIVFIALIGVHSPIVSAQQTKRPFTVADEIGLAHFGDPYQVQAEALRFSPDGNYFAVDTEVGKLDLNCVEDSLRLYRTQDIRDFLARSDRSQLPSPVWIVNRSGKEGPIIHDWRWLPNSSGVAFLEGNGVLGQKRLVLADLRTRKIEVLTSATEAVQEFDIRDRRHYVYTVIDSGEREKLHGERQAAAMVGTGRPLVELLFPESTTAKVLSKPKADLWAVVGDKHFAVEHDGARLSPARAVALSPDGGSLVTELPVPDVPSSWEALYPPPLASSFSRIHAGHNSAHQYVRIDLQTGFVQSLTDAPDAISGGWGSLGSPNWSSDGNAILLPGTFLSSKDHAPSRPCVAVVSLSSNTRSCVEILKGRTAEGTDEGYYLIFDARFKGADTNRVIVISQNRADMSFGATEYEHTANGTWQMVEQKAGISESGFGGLEIIVKQGLNQPPLLVAKRNQISRVIWDPNPQLKGIELGQASLYKWKDKEGRDWKGGLFKPSNYELGRHYPLVIQTHHFLGESAFEPSGVFPTAFAARALAAAGMVVLQVQDLRCTTTTIGEGPCAVSGYESGASQLVSDGLVDADKIGIIGFSRTCFYVMQTLTFGSLHLKAASITDGVMASYLEYIIFESVRKPFDSMIGAPPFGDGLQQWLKRSPSFNLDKITAPLLVNAGGPDNLLYMAGPYEGLRSLQKPVDLIVLNTDEHVLTNPAVRMASQGGTVDWFRFWLQDYEDPDPGKVGQYKRWRELARMQQENEKKSATAQASSN